MVAFGKNPDGSRHVFVHESINKTGKPWREEPAYDEIETEGLLGTDKVFIGWNRFKCSKCGEVVRFDERGYAVCPECGLIYNDFDGVICNDR